MACSHISFATPLFRCYWLAQPPPINQPPAADVVVVKIDTLLLLLYLRSATRCAECTIALRRRAITAAAFIIMQQVENMHHCIQGQAGSGPEGYLEVYSPSS